MAERSDWLSSRRELQLAMARNWHIVLGTKAILWNVTADQVTDLESLIVIAQAALEAAQSSERTPTVTAACRAAFDNLTAKMRFITNRWFLSPPLPDTDYVSLDLKPKDTNPTPVAVPVNQAGVEITKWAPHTLGFRRFIAAELGGGSDSDYGVRVYYALVEIGAATVAATGKPSATRLSSDVYVLSAPPQTPADLPNSFFTRRSKDLLELPPEASGKICYLAARFENGKGQSGPWGTIIQALVP
jgi:hypothetical protein